MDLVVILPIQGPSGTDLINFPPNVLLECYSYFYVPIRSHLSSNCANAISIDLAVPKDKNSFTLYVIYFDC